MATKICSALTGWIPVKLDSADNNLCRWLYVGNADFIQPFFDETILSCCKLPENGHQQKCMSSTDLLAEWVKEMDVIEPTAFIFHISRCGSTLISQMLGLQPANIILSEVPFFDNLLRYGKKHDSMPGILPKLKAAIGLYAARRNENQQQLFIKADSWHIHFYKELRTLYPAVPFFLLYRKPDEVIRSQQKKRGMQAIPNLLEAAIFGFDKDEITAMKLDAYMAMVLESYLDAFLEILQKDKSVYAVNYHDGAMEIVNIIATVTGLHISDEEKLLMQKRAGFHAKFPEQVFSEEKPDEPVPDFLKKSFELYNKIEAVRLSDH